MNQTIKESTIYKNADKTAKLIMLNAELEAIADGQKYWAAEWQVFEIYTIGGPEMVTGWDIHFVVVAGNLKKAKQSLKSYPNFDCIISSNDYCGGPVIGFNL